MTSTCIDDIRDDNQAAQITPSPDPYTEQKVQAGLSSYTWTSEYNGLAVTAVRRAGRGIDDAVLAHIWPTQHENVHFYGTHSVDVDVELAKLDSDGYRPLRRAAEDGSGTELRH